MISKQTMNLTDATLALLLASRIHGTDAAVKTTAKRCIKNMPRSMRNPMFSVIQSKEPRKLLKHLASDLEC